MKAVSAFRTRIAPRVQGIPDPVIDLATLDACIEFCEQSLVVKATLDPIATVNGTREYELPNGNQQSVARIMRVWCTDTELSALDEDAVSSPRMFFTNSTIKGRPAYFTEVSPGVVALYPTPQSAEPLRVRAAMRPTRTATQVEDTLFEHWAEAIVDGALARLFMQPGEHFNPVLSAAHRTAFKQHINSALLMQNRGRTRPQQTITPVPI